MDTITYKVLIADDEFWTREKIRHMIDWKKYALVFMEPAVDGEDVLKKIEAEQPDILITDINMPFINGVELLHVLNEKYPDIITFVISGYNDFVYVKDTFLAGSINYLLKPVSKIDLVNALSKALEIISSRQNSSRIEEKQKLEILKAASLIQDSEFSQLLEKLETPFPSTITMNSNIDFVGASIILIKIHNMNELCNTYNFDMNLLSYSVKKQLKKMMGVDELIIFNHIYRSNEFIIFSELENKELIMRTKKLLVCFKSIAKSPITIVISDPSYSIDSIHKAYIQVISMLMTRTFNKEDALLERKINKKPKEIIKIKSRFDDLHIKELKSLLKKNNKAAIKSLIFDKVGLSYCEEEKWDYLEVKQTVKRILNTIMDTCILAMDAGEMIALENMADLADKVVEMLDVNYLCEVLLSVIDMITTVQFEEASDSIRGAVRQAVTYIDENYFEELTLSSLAEQFNVENSYFTKVFRQETGQNLVLYIMNKRIEKAKEYMQNSNINLTEIAFMVGYDDYTYFSRVFHKLTGKSPREYRNWFSGIQGGHE